MSNLQSTTYLTRAIAALQGEAYRRDPAIQAALNILQARQAYITAHPAEGTPLAPGSYRDASYAPFTIDGFPPTT